jgi:oxalate decarboxylase/phosphoglucose isomerase-like protein (cupin superfamily)
MGAIAHSEGEGERLTVGGSSVTIKATSFVCVPPGTVHTFSNPGSEPVRFLNLNTPSGWEHYMRDLAAALAGGKMPSPAEIGEIASRYDFRAV